MLIIFDNFDVLFNVIQVNKMNRLIIKEMIEQEKITLVIITLQRFDKKKYDLISKVLKVIHYFEIQKLKNQELDNLKDGFFMQWIIDKWNDDTKKEIFENLNLETWELKKKQSSF